MNLGRLLYWPACILAIILFAWLYFPTAASFDLRWNTRHEAYSHGYILLALCVFLLLRLWRPIMACQKQACWLALLPLAALSLLWLAARITNVLVLQQMLLPALAYFLIMGLFGRPMARLVRFPFLLFYAAVPMWDVLNGILQLLTVKVCTLGLRLIDIPAFIEFTQISIPSGTFQVEGGCSGLNYLLMFCIIGAVYAHLYYQGTRHKLLLVGVSIFFGLLCNWIRVFGLVIIGYRTDMQSSLMHDHEMYGWLVFAVCLAPFLYLALKIETHSEAHPPTESPSGPSTGHHQVGATSALVAGLIACLGPLWYTTVTADPAQRGSLAGVMATQNSSLAQLPAPPIWRPGFANFDQAEAWQATSAAVPLQLQIVTYFSQDQGKELITWGNRITDGKTWKTAQEKVLDSNGSTVRNALIAPIQNPGNKLAEVIYWYAIGDFFTASDTKAKLYQLLAFLSGREDASLIALFYSCPDATCSNARSQALAAVPEIEQSYRETMEELLLGED